MKSVSDRSMPCRYPRNASRKSVLNQIEQEAVEWGWNFDTGNTMFHVIGAYTKGAQQPDLAAESSFKLSRTGGNILAMVS